MICGGEDAPGTILNSTQEYDGSSWTSGGNLVTARRALMAGGLQTATLAFGGQTPSQSGATEQYDGSSWTTTAAVMATARSEISGTGTTTAAFISGGKDGYYYELKNTITTDQSRTFVRIFTLGVQAK